MGGGSRFIADDECVVKIARMKELEAIEQKVNSAKSKRQAAADAKDAEVRDRQAALDAAAAGKN